MSLAFFGGTFKGDYLYVFGLFALGFWKANQSRGLWGIVAGGLLLCPERNREDRFV